MEVYSTDSNYFCNIKKRALITSFIFICVTIFLIVTYIGTKPSNYFSFYNVKSFQNIDIQLSDPPTTRLNKSDIIIEERRENGVRGMTPCNEFDLTVNHTMPSVAASFGQGRTANQLCYFATGYALWRQYGIRNFIDKHQLDLISETFTLPNSNGGINGDPFYVWREGKFDHLRSTWFPSNTNTTVIWKLHHNKPC